MRQVCAPFSCMPAADGVRRAVDEGQGHLCALQGAHPAIPVLPPLLHVADQPAHGANSANYQYRLVRCAGSLACTDATVLQRPYISDAGLCGPARGLRCAGPPCLAPWNPWSAMRSLGFKFASRAHSCMMRWPPLKVRAAYAFARNASVGGAAEPNTFCSAFASRLGRMNGPSMGPARSTTPVSLPFAHMHGMFAALQEFPTHLSSMGPHAHFGIVCIKQPMVMPGCS